MLVIVIHLQEKLDISCVHSSAIGELFRGIRAQMCNLITGIENKLYIYIGILFACDYQTLLRKPKVSLSLK